MGTPDTLEFPCPHCGSRIFTQTKPGWCESYQWETMEDYDAARFRGYEKCYKCGKWCELGIDVTYSNKHIEKLDKDPFEGLE
jgi:transcription elongation factor Elf1